MTSEISLGMQIRRQPLKIYRTTIHSAQYGLKWDIDGNLLQPILSFLVLIRSIPRRILTALDLYNKNDDGSIIFKMIRMELVEHEKEVRANTPYHSTPPPRNVEFHYTPLKTDLPSPILQWGNTVPSGLTWFDTIKLIIYKMDTLILILRDKRLQDLQGITEDLYQLLDVTHLYTQCTATFLYPLWMDAEKKLFCTKSIQARALEAQQYIDTQPRWAMIEAKTTFDLAKEIMSK